MSNKVQGFSNRLNKPAKAGILYSFFTLLSRGASVIFTPLYTRLLTQNEFGVYSVYVGLIGIFTVIVTLQLSGSVIYKGLSVFDNKDKFLSASLGLLFSSFLFFLVLALLFKKQFVSLCGLPLYLSLCLLFQTLLDGIRHLKLSSLKYSYKSSLIIVDGLVFSLLSPAISFILIYLLPDGAVARIISLFICSLLIAIPMLVSILRAGSFLFFDKKIWSFLLRYALPSLPHFLSVSLLWHIGKLQLSKIYPSSEVALFSLALSVGLLPSILTTGLCSSLIPWINRRLSHPCGEEKVYPLIKKLIIPYTVAVLLFICILPELFMIMAPRAYFPALKFVYPIALSTPLYFLATLMAAIISFYKKTLLLSLCSGVTGVIAFLLNLFVCKRFGVFGASIIILPITLLLLLSYVAAIKYRIKHSTIPLKRLILFSLIAIPLSIPILLCSHSFLSRILFILALFLAFIPFIKEGLLLMKESNFA